MILLRCSQVTKRFGRATAVEAVDLEVASGEVLALVGPSGCGKTTLLRLIAGFDTPDGGTIRLRDTVLVGEGTFLSPERRRIGMVFQDFALFPHIDVAGNIAFGLPRGVPRKSRVAELLELVGLPGLQSRMPHELSGGQQQRVAIARALAAEPEILLLDEPFSNLDPGVRQRMRGEVRRLIEEVGITAVFVTHDQDEALSLAERVAVMVAGQVRQHGTPREVYLSPADRDVAEFMGEANFLPGAVETGSAVTELGRIALEGPTAGVAEVMVRAEDIELVHDGGAPAELVAVEYFGHDSLATLRLASGHTVRARWKSAGELRPGSRVQLAVAGRARSFPPVD
ncbi:MAG: ABC transporter ATP-binding protein [Dehalococcoidia bacterium]|nr:ABC transporter ATP-binding protein [Dehalococcoidia bacterium]